jgi:hypothetical protein
MFLWQLPLPASPKAALFENSVAAAEQATVLGDTVGSFVFRDERGNAARPITVWYAGQHSSLVDADRALMHGNSRTGRQARYGRAVRASTASCSWPQFSQEHYPGRWIRLRQHDGLSRPVASRAGGIFLQSSIFDFVRGARMTVQRASPVRWTLFIVWCLRTRGSLSPRRRVDTRPIPLPVHSVDFHMG